MTPLASHYITFNFFLQILNLVVARGSAPRLSFIATWQSGDFFDDERFFRQIRALEQHGASFTHIEEPTHAVVVPYDQSLARFERRLSKAKRTPVVRLAATSSRRSARHHSASSTSLNLDSLMLRADVACSGAFSFESLVRASGSAALMQQQQHCDGGGGSGGGGGVVEAEHCVRWMILMDDGEALLPRPTASGSAAAHDRTAHALRLHSLRTNFGLNYNSFATRQQQCDTWLRSSLLPLHDELVSRRTARALRLLAEQSALATVEAHNGDAEDDDDGATAEPDDLGGPKEVERLLMKLNYSNAFMSRRLWQDGVSAYDSIVCPDVFQVATRQKPAPSNTADEVANGTTNANAANARQECTAGRSNGNAAPSCAAAAFDHYADTPDYAEYDLSLVKRIISGLTVTPLWGDFHDFGVRVAAPRDTLVLALSKQSDFDAAHLDGPHTHFAALNSTKRVAFTRPLLASCVLRYSPHFRRWLRALVRREKALLFGDHYSLSAAEHAHVMALLSPLRDTEPFNQTADRDPPFHPAEEFFNIIGQNRLDNGNYSNHKGGSGWHQDIFINKQHEVMRPFLSFFMRAVATVDETFFAATRLAFDALRDTLTGARWTVASHDPLPRWPYNFTYEHPLAAPGEREPVVVVASQPFYMPKVQLFNGHYYDSKDRIITTFALSDNEMNVMRSRAHEALSSRERAVAWRVGDLLICDNIALSHRQRENATQGAAAYGHRAMSILRTESTRDMKMREIAPADAALL